MENTPIKGSNELALERTSLAAKRTLMAADRSLMAWLRTALSMISFGFTIYKFLQGIQASEMSLRFADNPRIIGLFLVGMGTISMVLGTIEYGQTIKELRKIHYYRLWRPTFVMSLIIAVAGLIMFISIVTRIL